MGLFDVVSFNPKDIEAVHNGTASRAQVFAVLTSQTCGEACWHAREEICRCSCGGKNHGCLNHGGTKPERTSRIGGYMYRLKAVGRREDVCSEGTEINRLAGWRAVDKPSIVIDHSGCGYTEADADKARAEGKEVWYSQYKYTWALTDNGAPARLKTATESQRNWSELSGWKAERDVYLLWERIDKPLPATQLVIDKQTGKPLENQLPDHCY